MFDWKTLAETAAQGAPFTNIVVIGLVEWLKSLKNKDGVQVVSGSALTVAALVIGMVFGGAFMFFTNRPPATSDWYVAAGYGAGLIVYGLVQGLIASKIYDAGVTIANKIRQ